MNQCSLRKLTAVLLCVASVALVVSLVVDSPLAWPWGADERSVRMDYPMQDGSRFRNRYFGPIDLMGERVDRSDIRFTFVKGKGLQRATVSLPPGNWRRLVSGFERDYGAPRYGFMRTNNLFTHYWEWSTAEFSITASITTIGDDPKGHLYAYPEGILDFQIGPTHVSTIDMIEKSRLDGERLQEQIRGARAKDKESSALQPH